MIIIYASKPFISHLIIECFKENNLFKDKKIICIHSLYFLNISHKFPNNIKFSDIPTKFNPEFKFNNIEKWRPLVFNNYELSNNNFDFSMINNIEKIIFCGDPCPFDSFYFSVFLNHFNIDKYKVSSSDKIFSLDKPSLKKYFSEEKNFFNTFSSEIEYGKIKDYFNFQFNIHSLVLFGKLLKTLNKDNQKYFISKYMIQFLYFIENLNPKTTGQLFSIMEKWKGTGKYNEREILGSSTSKLQIIENLLNLEFISNENDKIIITKEGLNFLKKLPKDCKDFDLPFRLHHWCLLPFDDAKSKIDYYIYHYFRKIKNHL